MKQASMIEYQFQFPGEFEILWRGYEAEKKDVSLRLVCPVVHYIQDHREWRTRHQPHYGMCRKEKRKNNECQEENKININANGTKHIPSCFFYELGEEFKMYFCSAIKPSFFRWSNIKSILIPPIKQRSK